MTESMSDRLRKQLGGPRDGALLRFSLGNALRAEGDLNACIEALRQALEFNPNYSAAWKLLGGALLENGDTPAAAQAWERGIEIANRAGDIQAGKEMQVFLRRLHKQQSA